MKISIRTSKHQNTQITSIQLDYANECVKKFMEGDYKPYKKWGDENGDYIIYTGSIKGVDMGCDVYKTKTQISAIVYYR
tara:strand:+ start:7918 stop:8154 length:237 start_codon:yes stop_codon:yes gene_type:complete